MSWKSGEESETDSFPPANLYSKEEKKMIGVIRAMIVIVIVIILIVLLCMGYVKAPPDMAFIISGIKKKSKVVIGKASIRIP